MSNYRKYSIGDHVLIWFGNHDGERTEGRVVHAFRLPDWSNEQYVVEVDTAIDPILEVRSGHVLHMLPSNGSIEYESWSKP